MTSPARPHTAHRRLPPMAPISLLLGLFSAAVSGCTEDFAPYNRLEKLRVLAVRGEPASALPGQAVMLDTFVYTPAAAPAATFAWSWCPFAGSSANGYPCRVTEDELRMLAAASGADPSAIPPYDLGTGPTASLSHAVDPKILAGLCMGQPGVPALVDCNGGFPIQVKVVVTSGDESVTAVHTVRFRRNEMDEANANPTLNGLAAVLAGAMVPITQDGAVELPRDERTTLRATVDPSVSEPYTDRDDFGKPVASHERIYLSWFVESGSTRNERTGYIPDAVGWDVALENRWTPARRKDYEPDTSRLIVVIRDNRGGTGWAEGLVKLAGSP